MKNLTIFIIFSSIMITLVALAIIPQTVVFDDNDYIVFINRHRIPSQQPDNVSVAGDCDAAAYGMDCETIEYLENNLIQPVKDGKVFCVNKKVGQNEAGNEIYVSYFCQEFYLSGGKIYRGSGQAGPAKVAKSDSGSLSIWIPRDGSYFSRDLEEFIPEAYRQSILEPVGERDMLINQQRAKNYFKADFDFQVEKITETACNYDFECTTPAEYLLMSRCPFTSSCVSGKCAVICPDFQNLE